MQTYAEYRPSGWEVPLPSILTDDYDQQYLWPKQYLRSQRKQLRKLLCA
jgi:hypothetical protein